MASALTKQIREFVKDPQSGSDTYGTWWALNPSQRLFIRKVTEYVDAQDDYIAELEAKIKGR